MSDPDLDPDIELREFHDILNGDWWYLALDGSLHRLNGAPGFTPEGECSSRRAVSSSH
jgi:hypothetical protein